MITGMHHFSFTVSDLDKAVNFFCDTLGLKASPAWEMDGEPIQTIVGMPGTSLKLCNVLTPDNNVIELIEYVAPKGKEIDLSTCNTGVAHLAFKVDNIEKTYEDLQKKGVKIEHGPVRPSSDPASIERVLGYIKGPDNITIEFIGPLN